MNTPPYPRAPPPTTPLPGQGKKRIGKAAKHWRRAARLAGAENPDEMLAAYLDGKRQGYPRKLLKKVLASVRFTRRRWKKVGSNNVNKNRPRPQGIMIFRA